MNTTAPKYECIPISFSDTCDLTELLLKLREFAKGRRIAYFDGNDEYFNEIKDQLFKEIANLKIGCTIQVI